VAVTQLRAQLAALEQQNRRLRDALADAVASGGQPAVSTAAVAATNAADVEALRRSLAEADSRNHELAAATARAEEAATALKAELAARNEELQALSTAMDETKQENDDLSMKLESIGYGKIGTPAPQAAGPRGAATSGAFAHKAQSKASPGSGVKSPSADVDVDTAADAKQEPPDDNDVNINNDKKTIRDLQMQMQDRHQAYCTDVVALRKKADEAAAARDAAATRAEELLAALHKAEHDLMSVHYWQEVHAQQHHA
jgi:chromosome segregation ATPase